MTKPQLNLRADAKDPYLHWNLRNARVEAGYFGKDVAAFAGISLAVYSSYENLRAYPRDTVVAERIAVYLGKTVDDLFPLTLRQTIAEVRAERKISKLEQEVEGNIMNPEIFSNLSKYEVEQVANDQRSVPDEVSYKMFQEKIEKVLCTLTFKERKIMGLRYGLGTGDKMTLEQAAKQFHMDRMKVREIERKAVSRLQHPVRSRKLEGFL